MPPAIDPKLNLTEALSSLFSQICTPFQILVAVDLTSGVPVVQSFQSALPAACTRRTTSTHRHDQPDGKTNQGQHHDQTKDA